MPPTLTPFPEDDSQLTKGVMPIITENEDGYKVLGTGFAINKSGLMITAAHVIMEAHKKGKSEIINGKKVVNYNLFAMYASKDKYFPEDNNFIGGYIPISHVCVNESIDIAFCLLNLPIDTNSNEKLGIKVFPLSFDLPIIGSQILAIGYYDNSINSLPVKGSNFNDFEYKQSNAFSKGNIIEIHNHKRGFLICKGPCFETDAEFKPAMSGGPIIGENKHVVGMISSGGITAGVGALLWPSLGMPLSFLPPNTLGKFPCLQELICNNLISSDGTEKDFKIEHLPNGSIQINKTMPKLPISEA